MPGTIERYADIVKRLTASKGGDALLSAAPELTFSVELEGQTAPPELAWLGRSVRAMGYWSFNASAAQYNRIVIWNAGVGSIMVVEEMYSSQIMYLTSTNSIAGFTAQNVTVGRDTRFYGSGLPRPQALYTLQDATASAAGSILPAGVWKSYGIVLAPLTGIVLRTAAQNIASEFAFHSYARQADPEELTK